MTDKIGVLGQASATAIGTETAYTVPSGKGAKVQIMYYGQAGSGGASTLEILVNGMPVMKTAAKTASHYVWSTGLLIDNSGSARPTGATQALTVAPYRLVDYWLDAGDTIQYAVAGEAYQSMNFQVVGVEVDIA